MEPAHHLDAAFPKNEPERIARLCREPEKKLDNAALAAELVRLAAREDVPHSLFVVGQLLTKEVKDWLGAQPSGWWGNSVEGGRVQQYVVQQLHKVKLTSADLVVVPVVFPPGRFFGSGHVVTVLADTKRKQVEYFDPQGDPVTEGEEAKTQADHIITAVCAHLREALHLKKTTLKQSSECVQKKYWAWSCGHRCAWFVKKRQEGVCFAEAVKQETDPAEIQKQLAEVWEKEARALTFKLDASYSWPHHLEKEVDEH